MRKACVCSLFLIGMFLLGAAQAGASSFWVASSKQMPELIVREQLLGLPNSLKQLGRQYQDGWSLAFYKGATILAARSEKPSHSDERFDKAVEAASGAHARVLLGHLRPLSSGCRPAMANPYPFQRFHDGHNWLFGHNGGLSKELLISLIGQEYLNAHPPEVCNDQPPQSWTDSELYFIYLLKKIDEAKGNVLKGLKSAVGELVQNAGASGQQFNFILTDGQDVWAYKKGASLFYMYDPKTRLSVVSSLVPGEGAFEWKEFPEDNFALLRPDRKPKFYVRAK